MTRAILISLLAATSCFAGDRITFEAREAELRPFEYNYDVVFTATETPTNRNEGATKPLYHAGDLLRMKDGDHQAVVVMSYKWAMGQWFYTVAPVVLKEAK